MDPTYKGLATPVPNKINQTSGPNLKLVVLISLAVLAVLGIVGFFISSAGSEDRYLTQRLSYRLDTLDTIAGGAQANVSDDNLRKISSELSLVLTGDIAAIKKLLPIVKTDSKLTAIKTEETDKTTMDGLKDAKLNGIYDTAYKTALVEKLQTSYQLTQDVKSKSSSKSMKSALTTLGEHLNFYSIQLSLQ